MVECRTEVVRCGGVEVLRNWLRAYIKGNNAIMLKSLLVVLDLLPLTMEVVHATDVGKTIFRLSSSRPSTSHSDPGAEPQALLPADADVFDTVLVFHDLYSCECDWLVIDVVVACVRGRSCIYIV